MVLTLVVVSLGDGVSCSMMLPLITGDIMAVAVSMKWSTHLVPVTLASRRMGLCLLSSFRGGLMEASCGPSFAIVDTVNIILMPWMGLSAGRGTITFINAFSVRPVRNALGRCHTSSAGLTFIVALQCRRLTCRETVRYDERIILHG